MSELIAITGRRAWRTRIGQATTELEAQGFQIDLPDFEAQGEAAVSGNTDLHAAIFTARIKRIREARALLVADSLQEINAYDRTLTIPRMLGEMAAASALGKPVFLQYELPHEQALFGAVSMVRPIILQGNITNIRQYLPREQF